jgi:hypothetical protein
MIGYGSWTALALSAVAATCMTQDVRISGQAPAATRQITPDNFTQSVASAAAGDILVLGPGIYRPIVIQDRHHVRPVRIDASRATLTQINFRRSSGWVVQGGAFLTPNPNENAVLIDGSRRISVIGTRVSGQARTAISVFRNSSDIQLLNNRLSVRSDGINVTYSQRVLISGNSCTDFRPVVRIDHADCIQMWTRLGQTLSDITITNNTAVGPMQGITMFDPGQGGADRITITNNRLILGLWHGITMYEARNLVIRNNTVDTIPGTVNESGQTVHAWINTRGSTYVTACDNTVSGRDKYGTARCPSNPI